MPKESHWFIVVPSLRSIIYSCNKNAQIKESSQFKILRGTKARPKKMQKVRKSHDRWGKNMRERVMGDRRMRMLQDGACHIPASSSTTIQAADTCISNGNPYTAVMKLLIFPHE